MNRMKIKFRLEISHNWETDTPQYSPPKTTARIMIECGDTSSEIVSETFVGDMTDDSETQESRAVEWAAETLGTALRKLIKEQDDE